MSSRLSDSAIAAVQAKIRASEACAASGEEEKLLITAKKGGYDVKVHLEFASSSDPDYLSTKEKEIIATIKKQLLSDPTIDDRFKSIVTHRFLAVFLIARKWDIDRTVELIKGYFKLRLDHQLMEPIQYSDISSLPLITSPYASLPAGLFDPLGRPISYIILRNFFPKIHSFDDQLKYTVFIMDKMIEGLHLINWRRGSVYVEDLKGVGFKNMSKDGDKTMKLLENAIPIRINKIILLNPNWMFRLLISVARLFMKKSVMERMHLVKTEELKYYVGGDKAVLKEWGGELQLTKENDVAAKDLPRLDDLNIDE